MRTDTLNSAGLGTNRRMVGRTETSNSKPFRGERAEAQYGWVKEPIELSQARCLELLSGFEVGRVALCTDTGPLAWPVNYSMVEDAIVFRTSPHSLLGTMAWNSRPAFEVDRIDLDREEGWSVLASAGARSAPPRWGWLAPPGATTVGRWTACGFLCSALV